MSFIEVKDACKAYSGQERGYALHPTSLAVAAGDYVAIVGKSGSGKTTLLNLIAGLDDPTSGSVLVGGRNISALSENSRAKWRSGAIGVVFQFYQLLPTISVTDNLLLAMSLNSHAPAGNRRARARQLLAAVGIEAEGARLPPTLSGGQQQRAAIARALANDPPLLLMDEPTGSIDSEATEGILGVLDDLHRRGRTLVVITHDSEVAARAHRKITLRDGRVIADAGSSS